MAKTPSETLTELQTAATLIQYQLQLLGQTVEAAGALLVQLQQQLTTNQEDP